MLAGQAWAPRGREILSIHLQPGLSAWLRQVTDPALAQGRMVTSTARPAT
jgi:hypothetical protein